MSKFGNDVSPESLSGMDLVYAVYRAESDEMVGSAEAGFAFYREDINALVIITDETKSIIRYRLHDIERLALDIAKEADASFFVYDEKVICHLDGISQAGKSYAEAAMRALLVRTRRDTCAKPTLDDPTPTRMAR